MQYQQNEHLSLIQSDEVSLELRIFPDVKWGEPSKTAMADNFEDAKMTLARRAVGKSFRFYFKF